MSHDEETPNDPPEPTEPGTAKWDVPAYEPEDFSASLVVMVSSDVAEVVDVAALQSAPQHEEQVGSDRESEQPAMALRQHVGMHEAEDDAGAHQAEDAPRGTQTARAWLAEHGGDASGQDGPEEEHRKVGPPESPLEVV